MIILSLCDYSGVWSEPYRQAGYDVIRVDLQAGAVVRSLQDRKLIRRKRWARRIKPGPLSNHLRIP